MNLLQRIRRYFLRRQGVMVVSQRRRDALTGAVELMMLRAVPLDDGAAYRVTVRSNGRAARPETWSRNRLSGLPRGF